MNEVPQMPGAVGKEYLGHCYCRVLPSIPHDAKLRLFLIRLNSLDSLTRLSAGITIAVSDVIVPQEKVEILKESEDKVDTRYRINTVAV